MNLEFVVSPDGRFTPVNDAARHAVKLMVAVDQRTALTCSLSAHDLRALAAFAEFHNQTNGKVCTQVVLV